ncbi:hypothetical protein [Aureimonas phyllosphaerae]|uniref:hypothetical protein n=1 Tax=Aureimonas phyllosphaerae TaxID=1166078 RepID=UPI001FCD38A3|nr:hypothetical protein [Aureimonas phyllosphaerae]
MRAVTQRLDNLTALRGEDLEGARPHQQHRRRVVQLVAEVLDLTHGQLDVLVGGLDVVAELAESLRGAGQDRVALVDGEVPLLDLPRDLRLDLQELRCVRIAGVVGSAQGLRGTRIAQGPLLQCLGRFQRFDLRLAQLGGERLQVVGDRPRHLSHRPLGLDRWLHAGGISAIGSGIELQLHRLQVLGRVRHTPSECLDVLRALRKTECVGGDDELPLDDCLGHQLRPPAWLS